VTQIPLPTTPPAPTEQLAPKLDPTDPLHQVATFLGILAGDNFIPQSVKQAELDAQAISPVAPPKPTGDLGQQLGADLGYNTTQLAKVQPKPIPPTPDSHTAAGFGGDNLHSGNWAHDLLSMLNLPATYENIRALNAWQAAEGGGSDGPSHSDFNWLNTTRNMPGARDINKVGVKAYASYHDGLVATAQALTNGLYGDVLSAFARGNSAQAVGQAVANSKWGTGAGLLHVLGRG
jgi:hypothetical protein